MVPGQDGGADATVSAPTGPVGPDGGTDATVPGPTGGGAKDGGTDASIPSSTIPDAEASAGVCVAPGNVTTVSAVELRLEFHPVVPTPPDGAGPPGFPPRPPLLSGSPKYNPNVASPGVTVRATSDINVIPNPAVIPILSPPGGNAVAGTPVATSSNAARIEFSYYRPDSLNLTDDDARLQWTWKPLGGGKVDFLGASAGLKVLVYGLEAGEVLLTVWFNGVEVASYRALVSAIKPIKARFNILNGPPGAKPRTSPTHVLKHVAIANRYLRQAGVELVYDTDLSVTDGAVAVAGHPGIFRISVAARVTKGFPDSGHPVATQLNYRDYVANFAYVLSDSSGDTLGRATDRQASKAGATISDSGTPSTSWIAPTGIAPDALATTQTMNLRPALQAKKADGTPQFPQLFAMYLTDLNGDPAAKPEKYGNTLAHEFGHILNLAHRPQRGGDGLSFPVDENLMHPSNDPPLASDLDIIQARAILQSPLT